MAQPVILEVVDLKVHFPVHRSGWPWRGRRYIRAVDGVSFQLRQGETLGIVGESGCGKSTLGRAILQLLPCSSGQVIWRGQDLAQLPAPVLRHLRSELQIIFQDPLASLDPRMPVGEIIAEPLRVHQPRLGKTELPQRVRDIMKKVGLLPEHINRYPHEFSLGQAQRIGIARAMILRPRLIVADEPVSALDMSIQAQIVNLLTDLQHEFGISLLFISHNLGVVRHISHRILVMYLGKVMEVASRDRLYEQPRHPYTQALISAVPIPDPEVERNRRSLVLEGELPSPLYPPSGCPFRSRCPYAITLCAEQTPPLERVVTGQQVACFRWREIGTRR